MRFWPFSKREAPSPAPAKPRAFPAPRAKRLYTAASQDRLMADVPSGIRSGSADLRPSLRVMRARSRHIAQNNDYAKSFLRLVRNNVVGPDGFGLQMRVKQPNGEPDKDANDQIEAAYATWSAKGVCTVDGGLSRADLERLLTRTMVVDGEAFLRHVRGWRGNSSRYAVQVLSPDLFDETLNVPLGGGIGGGTYRLPRDHEIRMSVERDSWGRVVAYHVLTKHPYDDYVSMFGRKYERIPAEDIMHMFVPEELDAVSPAARGVPWMHAGLRRLSMLGGYEEAEVVAARTAAAKMGFYVSENGEAEEIEGDGQTSEGDLITEAEPGTFERLPPGVSVEEFSPEHPTQAFPFFVKAMLRGFSAGAGVSYNALANDLEGVNYSSMRSGTVQDRDEWKTVQDLVASRICYPVHSAWLEMALLAGAIGNLPAAKFEKFDCADFVARGWGWVDPKADIETAEREIALGVNTRSRVCAQRGLVFKDVITQLAEEKAAMEKAGIWHEPKPAQATGAAPEPPADGKDQTDA
jgi:lambda family phage portal protein